MRKTCSILFFSVFFLFSACGNDTSTAPAAGGVSQDTGSGPIVVGEYGSMTGSEANFGQSTHNGVMLALDEVNGKGGIGGRPVKVVTYDDRGQASEAGNAVTRLIQQDKAVALLGEVASSLSIAGGEVAQRSGVPMITPSSTNPRVTQIGDKIFRVCFLDDFQAWVLAKFCREHLKISRVATLYDQNQAYSKALNDYFKKEFTQAGGTITTERAYGGGDQDFSAQLTTIRGSNPEAIFIPGYYTDGANIALQVRKLGIEVPLVGGDGWDSPQLAEIGREAIEGAYYSNHYTHEDPDPVVQRFVQGYKARYKNQEGQPLLPDGIAALAYDAARLLFDAIGRAKSLAGNDIAAAIASTRDFQGVTGSITIDEGRNARKSAVIVQMKGGIPRLFARIAAPAQQ